MRVLVFYYDRNPYQSLLYGAIHEYGQGEMRIKYLYYFPVIGASLLPVTVLFRRLQGFKLLHVHWPVFSVRRPVPFRKQVSFWFFKFCIWWLKLLGYKIIWTVHNVLPHEPQTNHDLALMQYFSQVADAKIAHSHYTIRQMEDHGLNTDNIVIIPHGNYIGVYPENISREYARQKLNIQKNDFIILFFGLIRPYKGVDDLLKVFNDLHAKNAQLIIAGKCVEEELKEQIIQSQEQSNISFYEGYVTDRDVATYFKAADVVCLPFRMITTSGSALLALSFGRPIIAPRSGSLKDLPQNVGYLYDAKEPNALSISLEKAIKNQSRTKKLGKNARLYAGTLSWDKIAKQTYNLYSKLS